MANLEHHEIKSKKPDWIKIRYKINKNLINVANAVNSLGLPTVCQSALCPNINECWGSGTATFMLLGDTCTRGCKFCSVKRGNPKGYLDPLEIEKLIKAVELLNLEYVSLTSVTRDDLPDGGASRLAEAIKALKKRFPGIKVEILIPDFRGDVDSLKKIIEARPEVIAHNIEVVERITPLIRDKRANYWQSLKVLETIKRLSPGTWTKSSIMVGLGETKDEVIRAMNDLRKAHVDFLTIGQYLRPSKKQAEVVEYVRPEVFKEFERIGYELGFKHVVSGPFVRTSYLAGTYFKEAMDKASMDQES